jgi:hypothetical protein
LGQAFKPFSDFPLHTTHVWQCSSAWLQAVRLCSCASPASDLDENFAAMPIDFAGSCSARTKTIFFSFNSWQKKQTNP